MIGEYMTAFESERETTMFLQQEASDDLSDCLAKDRSKDILEAL